MLVYKYMSNGRFFTNFKLRFTPPDDLNDPLELVPHVRIRDPKSYARRITERNRESIIRRLQIENPNMSLEQVRAHYLQVAQQLESAMDPAEKEREHFRSFMETTNQNVGVLSLTTDPGSAPMWAHYGGVYAGLVVGFDSASSFFFPTAGEPKGFGKLQKVRYTNTPSVAYVESGSYEFATELFFTKAECWAAEDEWRVLKFLPHAHEVTERPSQRPIHLFEVPPAAVQEVVFGYKMSQEARAVVEQALAERAPHVAKKMIAFVPNVGLQIFDC